MKIFLFSSCVVGFGLLMSGSTAQTIPPPFYCYSAYTGASPSSCGTQDGTFYTDVTTSVNDFAPVMGYDVYETTLTNSTRRLEAEEGARGLRGAAEITIAAANEHRMLQYCPPYCEGSSSGYCRQICGGGRRRDRDLQTNTTAPVVPPGPTCDMLAAVAQQNYINLATATADVNCMLTLKNIKCTCTPP